MEKQINIEDLLQEKLPIIEVMDMTPFPVFLGKDGVFMYANSPAIQLLEADGLHQIAGKSAVDFTHEESVNQTIDNIHLLKTKKKDNFTHYKIVTLKQNIVEIDSMVIPITLSNEEYHYVIIRDSTELTLIQNEYLMQKIHYQTLIDNSLDAVALVTDNVFQYINKAGLKLFGVENKKEMIGKSVLEFFHPNYHQDMIQRGLKVIADQKITDLKEREILLNDGSTRYIESVLMPFYINDKPSLQVIMRDITEQKRSINHLIQSEKLTTAGQLSAGIAHEIRNPLTSIKGFLQLLEKRVPKEEHHYVEIMRDEIDKIERITGEMLSLSKPQATKFSQQPICTLLNEVITLLEPQAVLKNIEIIKAYKEKELIIECDKSQLKQVFINLIKNAIEAMDSGGTVKINIEEKDNEVLIHIMDQGEGIPAEIVHRIKEPFFTTKGTGTGLGLTICSNIMTEHQGDLTVKSEQGKGTTFTVTLPLTR
ncbi:PAS domain-containing protein [Bacillus timonensis]|nr:PAS domain-containing protein [Bacillus timonensis]